MRNLFLRLTMVFVFVLSFNSVQAKEPKKINCKRKSKTWLSVPENAQTCRKYAICYKPLHGDRIKFGLCEKVTTNYNEYKNTKAYK